MKDFFKTHFLTLLYFIVTWTIGLTLICKSSKILDLSQIDKISPVILMFLLIGLLFLLLPFFKKIKIGKYLEIETDLKQVKKDLSNFKTEIRQNISLLTTNVNTIGNLSNHVTINLPSASELKEESDLIDKYDTKSKSEEIISELIFEDEDELVSLAKVRMQMEHLLRKILNKKININKENKDIKFFTLTHLIREFISEYPQYEFLEPSFVYVRRMSNAAIHAQKLDESQIREGLNLGAKILSILKNESDN